MLVTSENGGHVMVVDRLNVSGNLIYAVDQNGADGGRTTVTYNPTTKNLSDGNYYVFIGVVHSSNDNLTNGAAKTIGSWDGGTKTNQAVFRPSNGTWYYNSGGTVSQAFGLSGDVPVPGWYSG